MGEFPVLSGHPPQWYGPRNPLRLQRERCMDGSLFDSNGIVWFLESHRTTKRWSAGAFHE